MTGDRPRKELENPGSDPKKTDNLTVLSRNLQDKLKLEVEVEGMESKSRVEVKEKQWTKSIPLFNFN